MLSVEYFLEERNMEEAVFLCFHFQSLISIKIQTTFA